MSVRERDLLYNFSLVVGGSRSDSRIRDKKKQNKMRYLCYCYLITIVISLCYFIII